MASGTETPLEVAPIEHIPRAHQTYPGSQYLLPTDDLERQRLLDQHNCLKSLFDNKILFAPVNLNENDKVLESATGPGFWLMELAASIDASVPMVGIDIESRLFPAPPPENFEFRIESVTNLPADWTDSFSLVHQRLLMLALQTHEWPAALSEIFRVLRPGGWVQIAEYTSWRAGPYPGQPCTEKLITMYRRLAEDRDLYIDCAYGMPDMLQKAGFVDIQKESRMQLIGKMHGEPGIACSKTHRGKFKGIKTPMLRTGGYGIVNSEAEYDELVDGLEKEWDSPPGAEKEFIIFWARKPLA